MSKRNGARGWYRDETGVVHEMDGTIDPRTGAAAFPRPACAVIYTYDATPRPDESRPIVPLPTTPPPTADEPKTFQDLLEAYGSRMMKAGQRGIRLPVEGEERAVIAYVESLHAENARLKAGLAEVAEALKELES